MVRVSGQLFRDHPRSRGVYYTQWGLSGSVAGSSPLARGLQYAGYHHEFLPGIIPARAGFTRRRGGAATPPADHPRSRGVYLAATSRPCMTAGSSPLARGLLSTPVRCRSTTGIIPARAGFTSNTCAGSTQRWDHPRSRGVYPDRDVREGALRGSSPLARGLRGGAAEQPPRPRIIPARAGFTADGEPWSSSIMGSSPLARGLHEAVRCCRPG